MQWRTATEALEDWKSGASILLPPTWAQLTALTAYATVAEALADEVVIEPILPILSRNDGQIHISFDGCEGYYTGGPHPWAGRTDI